MVDSWNDNTGVLRKYGPDRTIPQAAGEYVTVGPQREVELSLTLKNLTESEVVQSDTLFFPKGVRIEKVEIITEEAAATGVAIDIGLIQEDRSTEVDYQGFAKAFPLASMSALGETITLSADNGATGIGDLVGTVTTNSGYITASRTTSTAFTTGKVRVRIFYSHFV
jgi:hypothetical protein